MRQGDDVKTLLELRNIHKRYDSGTVALRDMSLAVGSWTRAVEAVSGDAATKVTSA